MGSAKDRRERRSTARARAQQHVSGWETTMLRMPEGVGFYELKPGTHRIDIVPYTTGKGNPYVEPGELHFERTFYIYRNVGPEEKAYVCPSKTFGKPDFIQEERQRLMKEGGDANKDLVKALAPKERQLFLVYDHDQKEKGLQIWEISYHTFGKLLDSRINNSDESEGWDLFYYPDTDGMTLRLTVEEDSTGGFKFNKVTAIDFVPRRDPLPASIVNHGICLDDLLVELDYEKLKALYLGVPADSEGEERDDKPAPRKSQPKQEKKPEPPKETTKPKPPKFDVDQKVLYKGEVHTVFRVSGDGTSLKLLTADEDVVHAVDPFDCELVTDDEPTPPKKEEKKSQPKQEKKPEPASVSSSEGDDDDWDKDWETD